MTDGGFQMRKSYLILTVSPARTPGHRQECLCYLREGSHLTDARFW